MEKRKKKKIKQQILSAGSNTFGCLSHSWEDGSTLPSPIIGLQRLSIKSFSVGSFHCAAVYNDGSIFGWGYNEDSQIGLPKIDQTLQIYSHPTQIHNCFDSIQIEKVKCGLNFTLFLDSNGEVYIASKKNERNAIEKLNISNDIKCINIFGNYVPWVLCQDGSIYRVFKYAKDYTRFSLNLNENNNQTDHIKDIISIREGSVLLITEGGKLFGLGSIVRESTFFIEIDLAKNAPQSNNNHDQTIKVKQIAGTSCHFIVLTEDGDVYVWGKNEDGQLGIGNKIDQKDPFVFVKLPQFSQSKIVEVAAGGKFSIFICENGDLWATGNGKDGQTMLGDEHERLIPEKSLVVHNVTSVFCGDSFTYVFIY